MVHFSVLVLMHKLHRLLQNQQLTCCRSADDDRWPIILRVTPRQQVKYSSSSVYHKGAAGTTAVVTVRW